MITRNEVVAVVVKMLALVRSEVVVTHPLSYHHVVVKETDKRENE